MQLDASKMVTLARATTFMAHHSRALSDFEVETLAVVGERFLAERAATTTTAEEWAVVEQALAAMEAAAAQHGAGAPQYRSVLANAMARAGRD